MQRDELLWEAVLKIGQATAVPEELRARGRRIAQLPMRLGGLGIRSSLRTARAAYWSSWADALAMIQLRNPRVAQQAFVALQAPPAGSCLAELSDAALVLRNNGFDNMPSWTELAEGKRPQQPPSSREPVDRTPGWQYLLLDTLELLKGGECWNPCAGPRARCSDLNRASVRATL